MNRLYDVVIKQDDVVVHTDCLYAANPNDAAEKARKYSQLHYNNIEVYDAYDESFDAKPIFKKTAIG